MMSTDRGDIFNLDNFEPAPKKRPVSEEDIRRTSVEMSFNSRQGGYTAPDLQSAVAAPAAAVIPTAPPSAPTLAGPTERRARRARTGRNRPLNIKMTEATANRMATLADTYDLVYGELIDKALDALEREAATKVAT